MWLISGFLHMLTSCYLESRTYKRNIFAKIRQILLVTSIVAEISMVYLYFRHNRQCEPYIYSYFCLIEYAVIVINMTFHMMAPPIVSFPVEMYRHLRKFVQYDTTKDEEEAEALFDSAEDV